MSDTLLATYPFRMKRCYSPTRGEHWTGKNAPLIEMALSHKGFPWPMRANVFELIWCALMVGDTAYPHGSKEVWIPSIQSIRLDDVKVGAELIGELHMEDPRA